MSIDWTKRQTATERAMQRRQEAEDALRSMRDQALRESDWMLLSDAPIGEAEKGEVIAYRQALRDAPQEAASAPEWAAGQTVAAGAFRLYEGRAYVAITGHTTQADWAPPVVPALWRDLGAIWEVETGTPPPWSQPAGAHDAYALGDRVTHNGQTWESTHADNVWEPGVFGWVVVTG